ncbi:FtsX-like permease family protein [Gracilibacillus sp. S3-1-1]|uniref:FtsX-like permease family protein n=1 Tax=Gracilibacillus pellucidus TaxID=3095368 RepID=A0ACC6M5U0_9BACI|nr:FtsX-like permease family protein [Gracilibacillus sp. S3-1-1]MDX8046326.1 FtsX-like permease family protein [Gracilibacillus sp. S3-1-1]
MKFKDQWRFVRSNMKRSKSRVFMTVLATAMGVTFLIVLASVGFGLQKTFVNDIIHDRAVTQIQIHGIDTNDDYALITDKEIEELEQIDKVKAVTRQRNLAQIPAYHLDNYETFAETVVTDFPSEFEAGMELTEGALPDSPYEVVVGSDFAGTLYQADVAEDEDLYNEEGVLKDKYAYADSLVGEKIDMTVEKGEGDEIEEHTIELTITGVVQPPAREWIQDQYMYISDDLLRDIETFTGTPRGANIDPDYPKSTEELTGYNNVNVFAHSLEDVQEISEQLSEKNYLSYSAANELKEINVIFTVAKAGLIFIGTIAIIIASIGIYNTMTMAVTERTPDIGIMKALGAHPKKIKQIFLLESSYIGLLGAVIGTIVAYILSILLNLGIPFIIESVFNNELPEGFQFSSIPFSLIAISTVICLIVTIISGLKPAKRATQVDVLKAMRREI